MQTLYTIVNKVYFYINGGIVFNISSDDNGDECAKKGVSAITDVNKQVLIPSFTVSKDGNTTKYFLDEFISDGDKYENNKFEKHEHTKVGEKEIGSGKTIQNYYEALCNENYKNAIAYRPSADFDFFNKNKYLLNVPMFMLSSEGYTIAGGVNQIEFTEAKFNETKNEVVQSEAYKAAQNKAKQFNYKVTSTQEQLTVEKITE